VSTDFIAARGLPTREQLITREHGTRLRYLGGCRCVPCRAANSRYECERFAARQRGEGNGLVGAAPARQHLLKLRRLGVGYKSAAASASVATSIVAKILSGERTRVRAQTARRILAVDRTALADAAVVPAAATWRRVEWLVEQGFTKARISREIGQGGRALQIGRRRVLARTAMRIEQLYRRFSA
jgi:hypothetical protein